jgi:Asp-tRNA(Asn)/Glu-tRNA(Gln) amidotransferase A subunit family amidase
MTTPTSPPEPSAREWLRLLGTGAVSARELTEHVLARIDAADSRLNAVVARDDEAALAAADVADEARRNGDGRPLLGLPMTIKDSLEVTGLPSTTGSFARKGYIPERDATVVSRLRDAGAIVVAKTNVPEYTWSYETENALHGRTVNPFDAARTPGGSSGGEAALLGADASIAGIGTDGGGSIRVPAHYCGIVGLRPTAGLVAETGCWPSTRDTGYLDMATIGPMARYVEDLTLLLPVIAGPDGVDPFVHGVPVRDPAAVDVSGLRVGVYTDDGLWRVSDGVAAGVEAAAAALRQLGCTVEEATPPDLTGATALFFELMAADGGAKARDDLAPANGRHVEQLGRLLEDLRPLAQDVPGFFALLTRLFAFRAQVRAFVGRYDVVLAPPAAGPAPLHGCTPGTDEPLESYDPFNYTHVYSAAGLPVAVVRVGEERDLPVGVQIVANAFRDDVALAAAGALERSFGAFRGAPVAAATGVS